MSALHTVKANLSEAHVVGDEPTWEAHAINSVNYNSEMIRGLNWHNTVANEKDVRKYLEEWMKEHRPKTVKQDVVKWREISDSAMDVSTCTIARMQLQGFVLNEIHQNRIKEYVEKIVTQKKERKATSTKTEGPTIQDRMRQQISATLSDLDMVIDNAFDNNLVTSTVIAEDVLAKGHKGPQLGLVQAYLKKHIAEWQMAYNGQDEQLTEGYAYVGKKPLKKILDTFNEVLANISEQQSKLKTHVIRKKKPQDKKKMASKLRFMKEYSELALTSENPTDIIGADAVWVYDTKKRKIGYYEAETKGSLYVKGTKIVGFKQTRSKTLRKPEEQLPQLRALRKGQTMAWFESIKTKSTALNGRTNGMLILLRID